MKILPDYLIQYMPEIEEAMEELRLSVIDHAYELLKRLDIDELSVDEIRKKLELYDISVSNMTSEWLPNGKFYRMYPYIKHHRSRLNTVNAIAKSGGQFEGVWSTDFNRKKEYNFYTIDVARHYQLKSDADGYFYISGDTERDKYGRIISSAARALSTDILINQALPAGYTYLYIPFPRPVYPADSSYFYNVHMLDYDRLYYVQDCLDDNALPVDISVPASTLHDWNHAGEKDSPYRTPYWFDYHYMDNMDHKEPSDETPAGQWPIVESGKYYDVDGYEVYDLEDAVTYVLDSKCKELENSHAVFPTKCYTHARYRTTVPNRAQEFTPYSAKAQLFLESYNSDNYTNIKDKLVNVFGITDSAAESILDNVPCKLPYVNSFSIKKAKNDLESVGCIIKNFTIDENCLTDVDYNYYENPGAYRYDYLARDYALKLRDNLNHIKTYKPFWNEKTPFLDMCYSKTAYSQHYAYYSLRLISYPYNHLPSAVSNIRLVTDLSLARARDVAINCPSDIPGEYSLQSLYVLNKLNHINVVATHHTSVTLLDDKVLTLISCKDDTMLQPFQTVYGFANPSSSTSATYTSYIQLIKSILPLRLYRTADRTLEEIKEIFEAAGAKLTLTKGDSLYNWLKLKQDNNVINAELYDDIYPAHTQTFEYSMYIIWDSLPSGFNWSIPSQLELAVLNVTGITLPWTQMGVPNFILTDTDLNRINSIKSSILAEFERLFGSPLSTLSLEIQSTAHDSLSGESVVKDNVPPISEITHTSYDRPTCGKLDPVYIGYLRPSDDSQGDNYTLNSNTENNVVYSIGESSSDYNTYDPELFYTVVSVGSYSNSEQTIESDNIKMYLECAPAPNDNSLFLNKNGDTRSDINYVVYKTSHIHKLYFAQDKSDVILNSKFNLLYNDLGSTDIYYHTGNNVKSFDYTIIGFYDRYGNKLSYMNDAVIKCTQDATGGYDDSHYYISCSEVKSRLSLTPDFNNQWKLANDTEDEQYLSSLGSGYTVYKSFSNRGIDDGIATMYLEVNFTEDKEFTLKIQACAEVGADGVHVCLDGNYIAYIYDGVGVWAPLTINVTSGKHILKFEYFKDSSISEYNDCAYVAIPTITYPDDEYVKASYVLFTSKVTPGHVEDTPIVSVFIKTPNDEIETTFMIPDIEKILINGVYITLEEFYDQGYSFSAEGEQSIDYIETASSTQYGNTISINDPDYTFTS